MKQIMEENFVTIYLTQGEGENEIRMCFEMTKTLADKMGEIRGRDPRKWDKRELDLLEEAEKELGLPRTRDFHFELLGGNKDTAIAAITINNDTLYRPVYDPLDKLFTLRTQIEQIILNGNGSITWGRNSKTDEINIDCLTDNSNEVCLKYIIYDIFEEEEGIIHSYCNIKQVIGTIYLAYLKLILQDKERKINKAYYHILKSNIIESFLSGKHTDTENYGLLDYITDHYEMTRDFNSLIQDIYPEYENLSAIKQIENPLKKEMADIAKNFLKKANRKNFRKNKDLSGLLAELKHIRLKDGYKLSFCSIGDELNYNSYLAIKHGYSDVEISRENISQYFQFEFTELAIWEMYILTRMAITILPKGWHGAYEDHTLISDYDDLVQIAAKITGDDSGIKTTQILENYLNNPDILPDIKMTSPTTATVTATLFTHYSGLQTHTAEVVYEPDSELPEMMITHNLEPVTLVQYDSEECF